MRFAAAASAILIVLQLLPALKSTVWALFSLLAEKKVSAIGIIGSADGPTSIIISSKFNLIVIARYAFLAACVLTFAVSIILLIKKGNKG